MLERLAPTELSICPPHRAVSCSAPVARVQRCSCIRFSPLMPQRSSTCWIPRRRHLSPETPGNLNAASRLSLDRSVGSSSMKSREFLACSTSRIVTNTKIADKVGVDTKTAQAYFARVRMRSARPSDERSGGDRPHHRQARDAEGPHRDQVERQDNRARHPGSHSPLRA